MDDFKNSTKTQYAMGGAAHAKGGSVKGAAKVAKVMGEFKKGGAPMKKAQGGAVARGNRMQAEEAGESRLVRRAPPRKTAMTAEERAMAETIARGNRMSAEEAGESRLMRRGVPAHRGEPMISRKRGGLAVMPKGTKC
ncbi:MAG: hypothetical protein RI988_2052 [Pseudomonadota bacterium]|jgi:hypothetical protein